MSAKSRSKHFIQLPIAPDDHIMAMTEEQEGGQYDGEVLITCASGRQFALREASRYKRPFKIREITHDHT